MKYIVPLLISLPLLSTPYDDKVRDLAISIETCRKIIHDPFADQETKDSAHELLEKYKDYPQAVEAKKLLKQRIRIIEIRKLSFK